jgi:hypothetical protein
MPPLVLVPPLNAREADDAVADLVSAGLLATVPEADEAAYRQRLAELLVTFSRRVLDLPAEVTQIDVNPVILGPTGSFAVDAVVVSAQ